jgi:N utilization substance protein B
MTELDQDPADHPSGQPDARSEPPGPAEPLASQPDAPHGKGQDGRPARKPANVSPRRRAREFALQGLYEWLIAGSDAGLIDAHVREQPGFDKCDSAQFDALMHGCIAEAAALDAALTRHVDRRTSLLSPVEHAALMIGAWELTHSPEVPYRVVINEAVELTKTFGGTDGHKYVNGVLDKVAGQVRPAEVQAAREQRRQQAVDRT